MLINIDMLGTNTTNERNGAEYSFLRVRTLMGIESSCVSDLEFQTVSQETSSIMATNFDTPPHGLRGCR